MENLLSRYFNWFMVVCLLAICTLQVNAQCNHDNYSVSFNGTSSYMRVPSGMVLNMNTLTAEVWVKPNSFNATANSYIFSRGGGICEPGGQYSLRLTPAGYVEFCYSESASYTAIYRSSHPIALNQWTNLLIEYNYYTHDVRLGINGWPDFSAAWVNPPVTFSYNFAASADLIIGAHAAATATCPVSPPSAYEGFFDGKIDEFRLYNQVFAPEGVLYRPYHTLSDNLPESQNMALYYRFDENNAIPYNYAPSQLQAASMNSGTWVLGDAAPVDPANPDCDGKALSGSATANGISTLNGLNALTVEAWVYVAGFSSGRATIVSKGSYSPTVSESFSLYLNNTTLSASIGNGAFTQFAFPGSNRWYHVALTWASGGSLKLYIDGVLKSFASGGSGTLSNNTYNLTVGTSNATNEIGVNGLIDEVAIYNAELPSATLYAWRNQVKGSSHPNYNSMLHYYRFDDLGPYQTDFGCSKSTINYANYNQAQVAYNPCGSPPSMGPVVNLTSPNNDMEKVVLTWNNPNGFTGGINGNPVFGGTVYYDIYRDGLLIGSNVASTAPSNSYTDNSATCKHTYMVHPYWRRISDNAITVQGTDTSVNARTADINFRASDAFYPDKVALTWNNIASQATGGYIIKRDGAVIATITSPNTTFYNDFDGIPGQIYSYQLIPQAAGHTFNICPDSGSIKPNGRFSGYVRSPLQAPVPGVIVTATATVLGQPYTYTDTTDATGFYEIRNVYYDLEATFRLTPTKGTHHFDPAYADRTIDAMGYNAPQANFIDTSVFTVSGKVTFPDQANNTGCSDAGVGILVNGIDVGIVTDVNGNYTYTAQNEGNYTFTPVYPGHTFNPAGSSIHISGSTGNVDFSDTTTDSLWIDLKGYCNTQICNSATFDIKGDGPTNCFIKTVTVPGNTLNGVGFRLPAQKYSVELKSINAGNANEETAIINLFQSLGTLQRTVDLRVKDTATVTTIVTNPPVITTDTLILGNGQEIVQYDTLIMVDTITQLVPQQHQTKYLYGGRLSVELQGLSPVCPNQMVLQQGEPTPLRINVWRNYSFGGGSTCGVNASDITIYDDISDSGFVYRTTDTSFVKYSVVPGFPNITGNGPHPYQKFISVYAHTADAINTNTPATIWAVVQGTKALTPTFVTKTPELPFLVLHDPPGDGSSATLTNGSSVSYGYGMSIDTGGAAMAFLKISVGAEVPVPLTGIVFRSGVDLKMHVGGSVLSSHNKTVNTTFTTEQDYKTSNDPNFVGEDADLVAGGSLNMLYGLSYIVAYDTANCSANIDTAFTWGANDFATTYNYTIGHIKNTIIPQLDFLIGYYHNLGSDSALIYQQYKNVWQQVVDKNHDRIANSEFKENRSFSAGSSFTYTTTNETTEENSIDFQVAIETGIASAFGVGTQGNSVQLGTEVKLRLTTTTNLTTVNGNSKEVSYTLTDTDPGDYFSVDIRNDKTYGVPAFKLVAGASSCPHEAGTQKRDLPGITVLNPNQQNVPINTAATFTVQLSNLSESQETRTYQIKIDPNSNLEGAVVRLAGQTITQAPASFTIPPNSSVMATMSVEAGPVAVNYNHLKLLIYPACDPSISAEALFNVGFQSSCSGVTLFAPGNNWLVNDASDTLRITYGGFNVNDTALQQVGLQIRRTGQGWTTIPSSVISRAQLQQNNLPYYSMDINMSAMADAPYEIRAFADCAAGGTRAYSVPLSGTIDRTSVVLLGTPSPADGVLNMNEEVSVSFSENIDCSHYFNIQNSTQYDVTLVRADNGSAVPFTYVCSGDKIVFTIDAAALNALQNVMLTARVSGFYDVNGNVLQQPIVWSFVVNNSPVFWQPSGVSASVATSGTSIMQGTLKNLSNAAQSFTLSSIPAWLSPVGVPASIAQGASLAVNFNISGTGLNPGVYNDTVYADFTTLGVQQPLYVQLTVYANSPVWTVVTTPAQMNMVVNFSLNSGNTPLSIDPNDRVAVFYGNQCRGVANIQYAPAGNSYAAYITVYGNSGAQPQEMFEFRMWDASTATEYQAVELQAFVENAQIGQPLAPMILHPAGKVQRIPLATGWNWVSTYLQPNNPAVSDVMKYTATAAGNIIKTNDSYAQYTTNNNSWQGTLSQIGWQKSYQIMVNTPTELQVIGWPLSDTVTIPVVSGWNWIGYPYNKIGTLTDYMQSFHPADNTVMQSSTQFSTVAAGVWNGSLQNMEPGRGYKLQSLNTGSVLIAPRSTPNWNPDVFGNEFNMNITAVVKANGNELIGNFIVGAFRNGTCVAVSSPQLAGSNPRVFLTLHGQTADNGQGLQFLIYDYNSDSIYTPTYTSVNFTTDGQQGTIETPFELTLEAPLAVNNITEEGKFVLHQNIPNPFNDNTIIRFDMPRSERITLQVFDYTGKLIAQPVNEQLSEGSHTIQFNTDALARGIYFYRMQAGEFTATKRMIIQ